MFPNLCFIPDFPQKGLSKERNNWTTSPSKGVHMREKLSQYQKKIGYKHNYFPQKACEKQQQQQQLTGMFNFIKQRRNFHNITDLVYRSVTISEENCIKRIVDCVNKNNKKYVLYFNRLSNNYLKSLISMRLSLHVFTHLTCKRLTANAFNVNIQSCRSFSGTGRRTTVECKYKTKLRFEPYKCLLNCSAHAQPGSATNSKQVRFGVEMRCGMRDMEMN